MMDFSDFLRAVEEMRSGECPAAKVCSSRLELANWFKQFALSCRAALPKGEVTK